MKKFAIATAIVLGSFGAHAATSGNLYLKGTVPALLSITVAPEAIASALPLNLTQDDTKVATVNEKSNSNTGYQVSIASANQGKLVHESEDSSIAYSLKYDGSSVDLASGDNFIFASAAAVDANKDIQISYTGVAHEDLIQGDYTDTVTFTIAAN